MGVIPNVLEHMRARGYRSTRARKAILDVLRESSLPLSAPSIQKLLARKDILPNKTTIYRELEFLKGQKVIRELQLGDPKRFYEIMPEDHHHHVICVNCAKIEDVEMKRDLDLEEKKISRNKKFKILDHSLEFYGICNGCLGAQ